MVKECESSLPCPGSGEEMDTCRNQSPNIGMEEDMDIFEEEDDVLGPLTSSLKWKEFFGSSVDLTPTLMTIYDNYVQDALGNDVDNQSCEDNENTQKHNHNHNHVTFDETTTHPSTDMNVPVETMGTPTDGGPPGATTTDAKKRPLSISSTSSSASSTSSLPRHQRKKVAGMVFQTSGVLEHRMDSLSRFGGDNSQLDVLTDEELEPIEPIPECSDSNHVDMCGGSECGQTPDKSHGEVDSLTPNSMDLSTSGITYIDKVVAEILATERTYVRDLNEIIQGYMHPLQTSTCQGMQVDIDALFGNIEEICTFNSHFLEDLENCDSDSVRVAQCFVDNKEGFVIYTDYCTNYPRSVEVLTGVMRDEATSEVFRGQQMKLGHSLPLGAYLLKPVQRVLKYHLLLQNILNSYDCDQEGHKIIEAALASMTRVAQHINEMKRRHEHAIRIQEIQSLMVGWEGADLTTYGELVLEESFKMSGAKACRQLFLFDYAILIAKKKEDGGLIIKSAIMCSNLMLIESIPGDPLSFHLIPFDNPRMQHTVQCRSLEQKRRWCLEVKRLILENYHAVIPDKAKQLVLMLGRSREEQDLDDSGHVTPEAPSKKQHSAPEYLERRRTRRKSTTILPDFGLLKGQKTKKSGRKHGENATPKSSPPMRRKSDVGCGAETTVRRSLTEQIDTSEVCRRRSDISTRSNLSERPRSRSLESINNILDLEEGQIPGQHHSKRQTLPRMNSADSEPVRSGLLSLDNNGSPASGFSHDEYEDLPQRSTCSSPVRKADSFRIATKLNRIDSLTMEESLRQRQKLQKKRFACRQGSADSGDQGTNDVSAKDNGTSHLDDGYVNVVFTQQGFQVISQPGQPIYSNVLTPSSTQLDHVGLQDSEGDYIELPAVCRPSTIDSSSPRVSVNINGSDNIDGTPKCDTHVCFFPPIGAAGCSMSSTPSLPDGPRTRISSDPGTCIKSQLGTVLENLGSKLYGSMLLAPSHAVRRSSAENARDGQTYSHGSSTFYLKSPLSSPNRSRSELGKDVSDDFKSLTSLNQEDPWVPRFTTTRKAATLSGYASSGLDGVKKQCPLRRSSSFTMGDSREDLHSHYTRGHRRQPSDTLVFMNRNAFLTSPRNIIPDLATERTLARLATPPRDTGHSDICEQIRLSKERGRVITRYATPPRTVDEPGSDTESTVIRNRMNTRHYHGEANRNRPSLAMSEDSNCGSDVEDYMCSPPPTPSSSRYPGSTSHEDEMRPDSMYSMTSSVTSSVLSGGCLSSPDSSYAQSPAMSPSSPVSTDNMIDSLKQAVHNLTARITRRGPRSLDASPSRSPKSPSYQHRDYNQSHVHRQDSDTCSERTDSPESDRLRAACRETRGRKDKRRNFVYQLARAYSNRIKRANIVDKRGRDGSTTARQLAALLKDNKPGSPSIGARMAASKPIVLGTYTLPRHRVHRSRLNKGPPQTDPPAVGSVAGICPRLNEDVNEDSELPQLTPDSDSQDASTDENQCFASAGKGLIVDKTERCLTQEDPDSASADVEDFSSNDSVDDSSLYYYENKFAADLEAGLEDDAFRDSAVYSDDGLLGPEDYPGLKMSIRDTVRLIEQRYRGKPIPKIEVKQKEKATGFKEILKTLETTQPGGAVVSESGDKPKSVRDRTRELVECATLTRIRQTSLSLGGADDTDVDSLPSEAENLAAVKKGWVKEVVKQLEHDVA